MVNLLRRAPHNLLLDLFPLFKVVPLDRFSSASFFRKVAIARKGPVLTVHLAPGRLLPHPVPTTARGWRHALPGVDLLPLDK